MASYLAAVRWPLLSLSPIGSLKVGDHIHLVYVHPMTPHTSNKFVTRSGEMSLLQASEAPVIQESPGRINRRPNILFPIPIYLLISEPHRRWNKRWLKGGGRRAKSQERESPKRRSTSGKESRGQKMVPPTGIAGNVRERLSLLIIRIQDLHIMVAVVNCNRIVRSMCIKTKKTKHIFTMLW